MAINRENRLLTKANKFKITTKNNPPRRTFVLLLWILLSFIGGAATYKFVIDANYPLFNVLKLQQKVFASKHIISQLRQNKKTLENQLEQLKIQNGFNQETINNLKINLEDLEDRNVNYADDLSYLQSQLPKRKKVITIDRLSADSTKSILSYRTLLFYNVKKRRKKIFQANMKFILAGRLKGRRVKINFSHPKKLGTDVKLSTTNLIEGKYNMPRNFRPTYLIAKIYQGKELVVQKSFQF